MRKGSSEQVRKLARRDYVDMAKPGLALRIPLGEIQRALQKEGFPAGHLRQIRTSLESSLFWKSLGLKLVSPKGQPDRVGTILVFDYAVGRSSAKTALTKDDPLLELSGLLKGAIQEGAAVFLTELRRDKGTRKESPKRAVHAA